MNNLSNSWRGLSDFSVSQKCPPLHKYLYLLYYFIYSSFYFSFLYFSFIFFKDRGKSVAKNKARKLLKKISCSFKLWPFYPLVFLNTSLFHIPEHLWLHLSSFRPRTVCTNLKPITYVLLEEIWPHEFILRQGPPK